jgi:hypothetical protein
VELASPDTQEMREGLRRAWKLAELDTTVGLQALELLDTLESMPPDEAKRLIERLRNHPEATGWHVVATLKRELQLYPERRNSLIQEAVQRSLELKREDVVPFVRWLVEQGEYLQVLALVNEDEARGYQPLLENYLTALTMLQRFESLERLINDPKVGTILSPSVAAFYRAHLAFVTRKPAADIRQALLLARNAAELERRGELSLRIAEYAEARGYTDIAEGAYKSASQSPRTDRQGFQGLIRTTESNGNTEGMLAAASEACQRWPGDPLYAERLLYLNLLTGRQMEVALHESLKLVEQRNNDHQRRLLVALGYWRLMDLRAATEHLQNMDLGALSPGQQAVFAAIARDSGTNNARQAALSVIRNIDPKASMLPEERACIAYAER